MIGTVRPSVGRSLPLAARKTEETGTTRIVHYQQESEQDSKDQSRSNVRASMSVIRSILSFSAVCVASLLNPAVAPGQSFDSAAEPIADHERAAIVWEVLCDKFDRVEVPTQVRLSMEGLNVAWIPTLPNVEFVLLSDEAVAKSNDECERASAGSSHAEWTLAQVRACDGAAGVWRDRQ
ncbi:MAG: hypothetical protein IPF53_03315 [Blastocatellia bacterium]|nr:hypothetical protein [Blastocatellia bacterium]